MSQFRTWPETRIRSTFFEGRPIYEITVNGLSSRHQGGASALTLGAAKASADRQKPSPGESAPAGPAHNNAQGTPGTWSCLHQTGSGQAAAQHIGEARRTRRITTLSQDDEPLRACGSAPCRHVPYDNIRRSFGSQYSFPGEFAARCS